MIFENIKSIIIPEGNVVSIQDTEGLILWKSNSDPTISLSLSQYNSKIKIDLSISNLKYENVQQITILYIKYRAGLNLTINTSGATKRTITPTESSWSGNSWSTYTTLTPSSSSQKYMIRAYLKYTDLDGNTQTLYTDMITTSFNGLA